MKLVSSILVLLAIPHVHAESEPNNEAAQANTAKIGEEISFDFRKKGDRDYFKIVPPADGVLRFRLIKPSEKHQPYTWWGEYEEEGKKYLLRQGTWDRRVEKGEAAIFAIRSHYYTHSEIASPEVLKGVFELDPPADKEPNDDPQDAIQLEIGEELEFSINPRYDRDRFRVKSPGDGVVRFELTRKSDAHTPYPWWGEYEQEGKTFERRSGEWDISAKKDETLSFAIRSNYYEHQEVGSPDKLKGRFLFEPAVAPEPDDSAETARDVKVGEEISFQLNPRLDRDYFRITPPGHGTLRFRFTQTSKSHSPHPWWGEYEENGKTYERRSGQWDTEAEPDEHAVFAIRSNYYAHNETGSPDVLKGVFDFIPGSDTEPNDTAEQATAAEIGKPVRFQLTPRSDRDYFSLDSPGRGTVSFRITEKPDNAGNLHPWWGEVEGDNGKFYEFRSGQWDRAVGPDEKVIFAIRSSYYGHNEQPVDDPITGVFEYIPDSSGEPNDTPEQAIETAIDEIFETVFMPLGDQDCYRFTAPGRGVFRLERLDEKDVHPGLYPVWIHGENAYPGSWETRVVAKGEQAVLAVRSSYYQSDSQSSEDAVSLAVRFISEPDAPENGDLPTDLTDAEIGKPFTFALIPAYDRDHFRFTSPKDGHVALRLQTGPPSGQRISYWWNDSEGPKPVEADAFPVQAGKPFILGLAPAHGNWSSEDILTAVIEYTDPPPEGGGKSRLWTFEIERTKE